jgi:hypothetical protein
MTLRIAGSAGVGEGVGAGAGDVQAVKTRLVRRITQSVFIEHLYFERG